MKRRLVFLGICALGWLVGAAAFGRPAVRVGFLVFGCQLFGIFWVGILAKQRPKPVPWADRPRRKQGVWADPPVAELDKSTVGQLLASRLRRVPGLRVVVARPDPNPPRPPVPPGVLWDRELDG